MFTSMVKENSVAESVFLKVERHHNYGDKTNYRMSKFTFSAVNIALFFCLERKPKLDSGEPSSK